MNTKKEQCPWCESPINREKFKEIESKIRQKEKEKLEVQKVNLEKEFMKKLQVSEAKYEAKYKDEAKKLISKNSKEMELLKKTHKQEIDTLIKNAEQKAKKTLQNKHEKELEHQRSVMENDNQEKLFKQIEKFQTERESFEKKIESLNKQVKEKKELEVEVNTINLFDELQEFFPKDQTTLLHSGKVNEKILLEIPYDGVVCGRIVIDARFRKKWQKNYAENLHREQLEQTAEHAILATTVFPKSKKHLCIEEGVIIAHPHSVIHIITLLRDSILEIHQQNLSVKDQSSKKDFLYEYISSEKFKQKLAEANSLTEKILNLDLEETNQHKIIWNKRGSLAKRLQAMIFDIDNDTKLILQKDLKNTELISHAKTN